MRKMTIVETLVLRTFCWAIMFSCLLTAVNILVPMYAIIGSFALGVFFMEREVRIKKRVDFHACFLFFVVYVYYGYHICTNVWSMHANINVVSTTRVLCRGTLQSSSED